MDQRVKFVTKRRMIVVTAFFPALDVEYTLTFEQLTA